jgi:spore coat protein A, manganese oxidase
VRQLYQGMAERYEVVIDFAKYPIGIRVVLQNLGVPNSVDSDRTKTAMAFDVVSEATDLTDNSFPDVLNPNAPAMDLTPAMLLRTRRFEFIRTNGHWTVNGKTWADVVNSGCQYVWANRRLGDKEMREFVNTSGGWFHPVHVHLIDFSGLDRNGVAPAPV